jgi:polysaccharide biosynthesis transport protein
MTVVPTIQERIVLPATARGDAAGTLSASEVWAMLRRRTVLIVTLSILFSGLAIGGLIAWIVYFPGYRSESLIECISNIPETDLTLEQQRLRQDEHERFVRTQALLIKSPGVLGEALKLTSVRETGWFRRVGERGREPLLALTEDLAAAPVRGTNFLSVSMMTRNAEDAATIVNEVVSQWYFQVKQRSAEEFAAGALDAAQTELDELNRTIIADQDRLRALAARIPPGAVRDPVNNITAQQVRKYGEQVAFLELELSQLEQFRQIYNNPEGVAATAEDRALVEQEPQVAELARGLFLLQQQRAADSRVYGPRHVVLRQLDAQIKAAEDRLAQLRVEKLRERRNDLREAVNTSYENTRYAYLLAQENLLRAEGELADQDRLLFDYQTLQSALETNLERRVKLDDYVKSLTRVRNQRTAINVNVAQAATPALERSSPRLLLAPVGVMFAIALAISLGLALELLDKSVRTSQDIMRHVDVALLGAVPDTDDEEIDIEQVETATRDHPRSMVAEAFRRIRTSLQFSAPAERQKTVMIASPRAEDGTTTVACNLAIAAVQGGRRVLLVDANFRRPRLRKLFKNIPAGGLSHILIGEGSLDSLVGKTDLPNLDVLGSGPTPPTPAELLGGETCRTFLREAGQRYDQVIIDVAPVLLASDATVLATAVDGVILVVRANRDSRGIVRRACSMLADVRAHLFGAVLNAAQVTRGGYFREQLRSYYDYQGEGEELGEASEE